MGSHLDAIRRVVAAFERSDWTEIDVRAGDVRVHLSADPASTREPSPPTVAAEPPAGHPAEPDQPPADAETSTATALPNGTHVVVAPTPGIFWRSPEPGARPFAEVGDVVDAAATVCIIEVMKLMNHVKAEVAGEVVAVFGTDGTAVRQGAPLVAIAPAGTAP